MDGYITAKEAAEKWNVSDRQVQVWCQTGMLEGITKFGSSWAIPATAEKPTRTRNYNPGRKPKSVNNDNATTANGGSENDAGAKSTS